MVRPALVSLIALALSSPAAAAPNCLGGGSPGVHVSMGVRVGGTYTPQEQEIFDKMRLRQAGIKADSVERSWLGCLKVDTFEGGHWNTEYYDPRTLGRKPLNLRLP